MILSEEEKKLVLNHRQQINDRRAFIAKQKECKHSFVYTGHSHNDDCYTCTKCQLYEWR